MVIFAKPVGPRLIIIILLVEQDLFVVSQLSCLPVTMTREVTTGIWSFLAGAAAVIVWQKLRSKENKNCKSLACDFE